MNICVMFACPSVEGFSEYIARRGIVESQCNMPYIIMNYSWTELYQFTPGESVYESNLLIILLQYNTIGFRLFCRWNMSVIIV